MDYKISLFQNVYFNGTFFKSKKYYGITFKTEEERRIKQRKKQEKVLLTLTLLEKLFA
jgi:hypothetical protein